MSGSDALQNIRRLEQRGAYREAAALADGLPSEIIGRPTIALERARVRMRQGRMNKAREALQAVDLSEAPPGEKLILALETASLHIYCDAAVHTALEAAAAAFAAAEGAQLDPAQRAEAARIYTRILLIAATYRETDAQTARQAHARLPELADTLEKIGHIDDALAARMTWAERLDDPAARLDALNEFAGYALLANRFDLSGEARVNRASSMLANGASREAINSELDEAAAAYEKAEHVHGPTDIRCVRAKLAIERDLAAPDELEACLEAYRRIDFPRGAISLLLDISQLAHERGDMAAAASYRKQSLEIAEDAGMGLVLDSNQLAMVDLLMRNNDFGAAIELCLAALSKNLPVFMAASYKQLLAAAYSFIDEFEAALKYGRAALSEFESVGALDSTSVAAWKLAGDLMASRRDDGFDKAEELLKEWFARDEERGDFVAAVSKLELIAQIYLQRFSFSPTRRAEAALLDEAEKTITKAEEIAQRLPPREAARRIGGLHQLRGQLENGRGNSARVEQSWRDAHASYEKAGLAMEAANCNFMIGLIRLNLSNQDLLPNFGEAETHLRNALTYYEQAGMRSQAADARYMLALLYKNTASRVSAEIGSQMLDAAIGHLTDGEADYDKLRRDYAVGTVLEAQRGKQSFIGKSRRLSELALQIFTLNRPDSNEAWRWAQRSKARALGDALGNGSVIPVKITSILQEHPDSLALVSRERELAARIEKAAPDDHPILRAKLRQLRELMSQDTHLTDYLELRTGAALELNDLEEMLAPDTATGRSWVCVDWISVDDRLMMITLRQGQPPEVKSLPLTLSSVRAFISDNLTPRRFRQTLRDIPELLRELDPLIAPLRELSHREELLLLSPTGPLYALPLHALEIDGEALLARNPVAYAPGFSVLRHCLMRRRKSTQRRTAAVFGNPSGDLAEAAKLVGELSLNFGVTPLLEGEVTRATFAGAIAERDIIHFQGHAEYDRDAPLNSRLMMADGRLTASDIFALPGLQAELVTLAACESAVSEITTGDEPLGLIPAFLYAGAGAILATLWRVNQTSTAQLMKRFYEPLAGEGTTIDKAQALRESVMNIRRTPGFESPYHWAPFVLYGDWH
jgi:CHAT domain-containing protein/tetratricopeptide (TPR) repeat protein